MLAYNRRRADNIESCRLKRVFGLSLAEYNEMAKAQGGVCALCHQPPKGKRKLAVDHCHKTRKIRALLCVGCNWHVGKYEKDKTWVERVLEYIAQHAA